MKNWFKYLYNVLLAVAAVTAVCAHNLLQLGGLQTVKLGFAITMDEKIEAHLGELTKRFGQLDEVTKHVEKNRGDYEAVTKLVAELQKTLVDVQKQQLTIRSARLRRGGEVSEELGKFLGAVHIQAGLMQGRINGESGVVERWAKYCEGVIGKAALTTTEIPLPTEWRGEVVELVSEYGTARKFGTVFPMGAGTIKLPKLGTRPAFGLIAGSASIGEKAPTVSFVTFTASKWGGLVRLPSEIDEDSIVALGQFIARYAAREMALLEDTVFWLADGSGTYDSLSGIFKIQDATAYREVMASTKTKTSDLTLANARAIRGKVAAAVIGRGKYFFHPSMESIFSAMNTAGDKPYVANGINGASLDGFPINWIDVLPVNSTTAAVSTVFGGFGDPSYTYLGVRRGMALDTSREAGFTTDEILVRALERFTIGHMAADHMSVVKTAAS